MAKVAASSNGSSNDADSDMSSQIQQVDGSGGRIIKGCGIVAKECNNNMVIDGCVEGVEGFVGCVEGVEMQHRFEEGLSQSAVQQRKIAKEHGLSEAEATHIRMQMKNETNCNNKSSTSDSINQAVQSTLPELDMFICGDESNTLDGDKTCYTVISPTDTTLPTSEPAKSSRSLVDVEEEGQEGAATAKTQDEPSEKHCIICSDKDSEFTNPTSSSSSSSLCRLPCCASKNNINVCKACMLVLTVATSDGSSRVGRCLRCRSWLSIATVYSANVCSTNAIRKLHSPGVCSSCTLSVEVLVEESPPTCDACFLGRFPLQYECEECHKFQSIKYPIYRSQQTATTFGDEMSVCNSCKKSSHWRIGQDQLQKISANDIPLIWGDDYLKLARDRVQTARRGIAKLDLQGRDASGQMREEKCCIL